MLEELVFDQMIAEEVAVKMNLDFESAGRTHYIVKTHISSSRRKKKNSSIYLNSFQKKTLLQFVGTENENSRNEILSNNMKYSKIARGCPQ